MRSDINNWKQEGRVFFWRYTRSSRNKRGWHISGNRKGCANIVELLELLFEIDGAYWTLRLGKVPEAAWGTPNFGAPAKDRFECLRITCDEEADELSISDDKGLLSICGARTHLESLWAGFRSLTIGEGDFGLNPNGEGKDPLIMFWWAIPD